MSRLKLNDPLANRLAPDGPIRDLLDKACKLAIDPFYLGLSCPDLRTSLHAPLVHTAREFLAEDGKQLRVHQVTLERAQHATFQLVAPDV